MELACAFPVAFYSAPSTISAFPGGLSAFAPWFGSGGISSFSSAASSRHEPSQPQQQQQAPSSSAGAPPRRCIRRSVFSKLPMARAKGRCACDAQQGGEQEAAGLGSAESVCPVCLDEYAPGARVTLLPCGHMFCRACVKPWLMACSATCPVCRYEFPAEQTKECR